MDPAETTLVAPSIASLPERLRHPAAAAEVAGNGNRDLPGEFKRREVLQLTLATLDADEIRLHVALNHSTTANPWHAEDDSYARVFGALNTSPEDQRRVWLSQLVSRVACAAIDSGAAAVAKACADSPHLANVGRSFFFDIIRADLTEMVAQTVLFELSLAKKFGLLSAEPSDDAFKSAVTDLLNSYEYVAYLTTKYPLLPVRLNDRAKLIAAFCTTTLSRLINDLPELRDRFGLALGARVLRVRPTAGDSHNGAARVSIIDFEGDQSVVYKPRSTSTEAAFQSYLTWLSTVVAGMSFRTIKVWTRGHYGWVEYVRREDASCADEVRLFYRRYGALIAAVKAIAGTDIHHENLIASGSHPILIDLETILQPTELASPDEEAKKTLLGLGYYVQTPLHTAMFDPAFLGYAIGGSPLDPDIGGTSYSYGALESTQEGDLTFPRVLTPATPQHIPRLNGELVSCTAYIEELVEGYRVCAEGITLCRQSLLEGDLAERLKACTIRIIFRYTSKYGEYVSSLYSPYALQSVANSEEMLSRLWLVGLHHKQYAAAVPFEYYDLWRGDVPYFAAVAAAPEIMHASGGSLPRIMAGSGWGNTKDRVLELSPQRCERDAAMLAFCLKSKFLGGKFVNRDAGNPPALPKEPKELLRLVLDHVDVCGTRVSVMDIATGRDLRTSQTILGYDFYAGVAGLSHAINYAFREQLESEVSSKARRLSDAVLLNAIDSAGLELGACIGLGGFIYHAAHAAAVYQSRHYLDIGAALCKHATRILYTDRHFDIFSGTAGALIAACALYEASSDESVLVAVEQFADNLISSAELNDGKVTWRSSIPSSGPTTGFAHGVTGIAHALLRAYRYTKNPKIIHLVRGVDRYVQSCYMPELRRWKEALLDAKPSGIDTWCHGVSGIAMFYDELAAAELDDYGWQPRSLQLSKECASFETDCLCHGTFGNLDLLVSRMRDDSDCRAVVEREASRLMDRQPLCGTEGRHSSLSLFNGFSGIAYQRMRIQSEGKLPSILKFEAPRHE